MRAPSPAEALSRSWALLKVRPAATLSLAIALLTSLFAVCCGLGIVAAPWFMCELYALSLASGTGHPTQRTRAWLWAGALQMLSVLVLSALAFLAALALGPDVVLGDIGRDAHPRVLRLIVESLGLLLGAGGLTLALVVHFEHAPSILIDRGGGVAAALLESARLVAHTGLVRTWATSTAAHGLQLAPALIATVIAASRGTLGSTLAWGLALLPLMALSIALGQGMRVASYLALRGEVLDPARLGRSHVGRASALAWCVLFALVASGPAIVSAALVQPARVLAGTLPPDARVLREVAVGGDGTHELYIPDTALKLAISERKVRVRASDGGGAGTLALPAGRVRRVRVARGLAPEELDPSLSLAFALEVQLSDGAAFTTWVDDAGVRLDDSLARRFAQRLPGYSSLWLLACVVWTACWLARALPPQARLRKQYADTGAKELAVEFERRALHAALWLVPAALLSATLGALAALR